MKKFLNILLIILIFSLPANAGCNCNCTNNLTTYKEYLEAIINDKAVIFNALNLSDCQREKFEQITQKNTPLYKQKLSELIKEGYKYKAQQCADFGIYSLLNQKINIYKIKHSISHISAKEDRKLIKILNRSQRSKYRNIKHLERHDLHKEYHPKDYYKSNPQMPCFGG